MTFTTTLAAHLVRRDAIDPSSTNPRKRFDPDGLRDLAATMAPPVGIIEPLVVRLGKKAGRYELVAGERRWRAAAIAGLEDVPVVLRELTDEQVIEIQIIENEKRNDIHALEQSDAFVAWQKLNPQLTVKKLAERIGMSERYVQNLLHYQKLTPEVREAFYSDRITAGHADLIVRLTPADQKKALEACFEQVYSPAVEHTGLFDDEHQAKRGGHEIVEKLASVRKLDDWIRGNIRRDVKAADPETLLPELRDAVKAADPVFNANAQPLLEVADTYEFFGKNWKGPIPLTRREWRETIGSKKCEFKRRAVVVLGPRRGSIIEVCTAQGKCEQHWGETIPKATPAATKAAKRPQQAEAERREAEKRRKERERAELLTKVADRALALLDKQLPKAPTPASVAIVLAESHRNSWGQIVSDAADNLLNYGQIAIRTAEKTKLFKAVGIDLNKLFTEVEAAAAPKKPAATKKPKPAREFLAKNAPKRIKKLLAKKKPAKRKAGAKK